MSANLKDKRMKKILIGLTLLASISSFADILKDKDGDLVIVDTEYGNVRAVKIDKSMGPFTIVSSNIIRSSDSTLYSISRKGHVKKIKIDNNYKPYTGLLEDK